MQMRIYSHVVGVFELEGDRKDAMDFVVHATSAGDGASDVIVDDITITQWTDPHENENIVVARDGKSFNKYTVSLDYGFTIQGGHAEAQSWIVDRFMEGEEHTHMHLQIVRVSGCGIPSETPEETAKRLGDK